MDVIICITLTCVLFDTSCTIKAPDDNGKHVSKDAVHNLG
jgi:hypothetical protein